jgi:predicted CoA-binding protein
MVSYQSIQDFLAQKKIAVAGVSRKKSKFGNALYNELKKKDYEVLAVNPNLEEYDGKKCYNSISELPDDVTALVINTKNEVTRELLIQATEKGIKHIWLQQGAANKELLADLPNGDTNIICKQCLLMFANPSGIHGFHGWLKKAFGNYPN